MCALHFRQHKLLGETLHFRLPRTYAGRNPNCNHCRQPGFGYSFCASSHISMVRVSKLENTSEFKMQIQQCNVPSCEKCEWTIQVPLFKHCETLGEERWYWKEIKICPSCADNILRAKQNIEQIRRVHDAVAERSTAKAKRFHRKCQTKFNLFEHKSTS